MDQRNCCGPFLGELGFARRECSVGFVFPQGGWPSFERARLQPRQKAPLTRNRLQSLKNRSHGRRRNLKKPLLVDFTNAHASNPARHGAAEVVVLQRAANLGQPPSSAEIICELEVDMETLQFSRANCTLHSNPYGQRKTVRSVPEHFVKDVMELDRYRSGRSFRWRCRC